MKRCAFICGPHAGQGQADCPVRHAIAGKTLAALAAALRGGAAARTQALAGAASFSTWLCAAALLHPDCENLRKLAGAPDLVPCRAQGHMQALLCGDAGQAEEAAPQPQAACAPDKRNPARAGTELLPRRPNAALEALPVKLSVSALSHTGAAKVLSRPAFCTKRASPGPSAAQPPTACCNLQTLPPRRKTLPPSCSALCARATLRPSCAPIWTRRALRRSFPRRCWRACFRRSSCCGNTHFSPR